MAISSIGALTNDIVERVRAVSSFNGRVGLAVGGQDVDPINRNISRPASWVIYVGDDFLEGDPMNPCQTLIKLNYIVKILVDYDTETNLINTHLPLLHEVAQAVQGGEPVPGMKWFYEGQGLEALEPDRMVWNQQYSIRMGV